MCRYRLWRAQRVSPAFAAPVGGLAWTMDGRLLACVSRQRPLLALSRDGRGVGWLDSGGRRADRPVRLSVTVADDGAIYVTDGSRANTPELWLADLMQNRAPSGRLIACDSQLGSRAAYAPISLAWPSGVVVSHRRRRSMGRRVLGAQPDCVSRANDRRRASSSRITPAIPLEYREALDGDYLDGVFRPAHAAHRIRAPRARVLRGDDEDGAARAVDRSDAWTGVSTIASRPRSAASRSSGSRSPGPPRAPTAWSLGSTRRARRAKACIAVSTAGSTASPRSCAIGARVIAVSKGRNCLVELPPPRRREAEVIDDGIARRATSAARCSRSSRAARSTAACTRSTASISSCAPARSMRCSARTARANRRCARRSQARSL